MCRLCSAIRDRRKVSSIQAPRQHPRTPSHEWKISQVIVIVHCMSLFIKRVIHLHGDGRGKQVGAGLSVGILQEKWQTYKQREALLTITLPWGCVCACLCACVWWRWREWKVTTWREIFELKFLKASATPPRLSHTHTNTHSFSTVYFFLKVGRVD